VQLHIRAPAQELDCSEQTAAQQGGAHSKLLGWIAHMSCLNCFIVCFRGLTYKVVVSHTRYEVLPPSGQDASPTQHRKEKEPTPPTPNPPKRNAHRKHKLRT